MEGLSLADCEVSSLLFADDLMVLGRSDEEIRRKLDVVQNWCSRNGMEVNFSKTKILDKNNDKKWRSLSDDGSVVD